MVIEAARKGLLRAHTRTLLITMVLTRKRATLTLERYNFTANLSCQSIILKQTMCHFKKSNIGATMHYFVQIEEGEEKDLEAAVASQGPISVLVDASHNIFRVIY